MDIIVKSDLPIRLDRYLRRTYSISQGILEKLIRQGKIKLNNSKCKSSDRVKNNDIISCIDKQLLIERDSKNKTYSPNIISLAKKILNEYLITENKNFIAINKPFNLSVQGGSKINLSIDDALQYLNEINNNDIKYKLVHRLDKNTSGILLIAKNFDSAQKLTHAFKEKLITKKYLALVKGKPKKNEGIIKNYLAKNYNNEFESIQIVEENTPEAKLAETNYKLKKYYSSNNYSLIEYYPKTGRTHQLRVHSKYLNCPIIGDIKYGGQKYIRMMLHAQQVIIEKNIFNTEHVITCPTPKEFFDYN